MNGIEKLKDSMVRVEALVSFYRGHLSTTLDMMDSQTPVTIRDLKTLLDALADRDISLIGPKLKTGKEIEEDIKEAKVIVEEVRHRVESGEEREAWLTGYDKGYKAGRDGEAERIKELVNKFWGL